MKKLLLMGVLSLTLMACERHNTPQSRQNSYIGQEYDMDTTTRRSDMDSTSRRYDMDNTGRNIRDRDTRAMTPMDQSENEQDRTITQRLRQAIMADESLSPNAKNIKIITIKRVITLRGPVLTAKEKENIAKKAGTISGVSRVDNQLEVTRGNESGSDY